ncbi:hypothetical protein [Marinobacter sp. C2H3]|uniref:hypothetical protein n=1 Tax=Marinobacter sp. C2H3 TaxID=3119003 RepID=UPI00300F21EE
MNIRLRLTSVGVVAVTLAAWYGLANTRASTDQPVDVPMTVATPDSAHRSEPPAAGQTPPSPQASTDLDQLRDQLVARYESRLNTPRGQVRFLEELMRYLAEIDPDHWQDNLLALLTDWFPGDPNGLQERAQAMIDYQAFVKGEQYSLREMAPQERRDFLWAKRRELFGDDAEQIWQSELRHEALATSLAALDHKSGSARQKATDFIEAVRVTYGNEAEQLLETRRQELTDRLLSLPSVQATLHDQDPGERRSTLRDVRKTLGMPADALARWDRLDSLRDQRWATGQHYEARRREIVAQLPDADARAKALSDLRQDLFDSDQASIIAGEEAAGYYRYQQQRVYGQN